MIEYILYRNDMYLHKFFLHHDMYLYNHIAIGGVSFHPYIGPVNLYIIMFKIRKIEPNSGSVQQKSKSFMVTEYLHLCGLKCLDTYAKDIENFNAVPAYDWKMLCASTDSVETAV